MSFSVTIRFCWVIKPKQFTLYNAQWIFLVDHLLSNTHTFWSFTVVKLRLPTFFLNSHIFFSKSWCRTLICIEIFNKTFLQAFVIFLYSIYWTNEAKIKLITQSMTLNPWWGYSNPFFGFSLASPFQSTSPIAYTCQIQNPRKKHCLKNQFIMITLRKNSRELFQSFQFFQTISDKISLANHLFKHLGSPFPHNQCCSHECSA